MLKWTVIVAASVLFAAAVMGEDDGTIEVRRDMLSRNNEIRAKRGLAAHRESPALMAAAQDHAGCMARTRVFSHYSNGGPGGRATRHGFDAGVRENIACGYATVDQVFRIWVNSGGHYANLTSGTSDAGFGWAIGGDGTPYWVAVYGTPPAPPKEDGEADDVSTETTPRWRPQRRFLGWLLGR